MATVRLSASIRNQITNNIIKMFDSQLSEAKNEIGKHGDVIYAALIPEEYIVLMEKLPPEFFPQANSITTYLEYKGKSLSLDMRLSQRRRISEIMDHDYKSRTVKLENMPHLIPLFGPLLDNYHELESRRDLLRTQVAKLMANNATVGLCVKAWPQFVELLSPSIRAQHEEVSEKVKREKVVLDNDLKDNLNTSLMVGKLTGG